jgi:tetratricopeptide (TPR) repeat protein
MSITGDIGRGDDADSTLQVANQALERGEFRQAFDGYRKVLEQDPHNVEALTQLGVILAKAQHYDDAILAFDRALSLRPDDPKALFEKGLVLFRGKVEPREGMKVWEQLITTAPPGNEYAVTARRLLEQVRQSMGRPSPSSPPASTK